MRKELKGCFVRKPTDVSELRARIRKGCEEPIEVVATEWLEEKDYLHFTGNMMEDYPFIQRHTDQSGVENGRMRCILVRCKGHREAIAVEPDAYARYAALVTVE